MNEVAGDMDNTLRVLNGKNGKQKWIHRLKEKILKNGYQFSKLVRLMQEATS